MEYYTPPPIQIEIQVEQEVSQTYTVNCNNVPLEVAASQVQDMALALHTFLSNPDNIAGQPEGFHPYLQPPPPLSIPEGAHGVFNGLWGLTCRPGPSFSWTQRPTAEHMLSASLGWDEDAERWFVRGVRLSNLRRP